MEKLEGNNDRNVISNLKNQCIQNPFRIECDKFFKNLRFNKNNSKNRLKETRCSSMFRYPFVNAAIKKKKSKKEDKGGGEIRFIKGRN